MSDTKIKSGFNPSNYGSPGANQSDKPFQTKNSNGGTSTGAQNSAAPTSAAEKKGYDNSASLKLKLLNNRQTPISDETVKTSAPGDDNRVFKTTGGAWRLKKGETANNPEFYRDGANTAGTTLFDKRFYRHEGKWIELNARGRLFDLPENKGKPRPDNVSEFDWQGWREASAAEIPADYSAEGKTVAFTDTNEAEKQKSLFKRYVVEQNLVGDWDEVLGDRMIDAAIQKGAKIEAVSTGKLNGDGKTVFAVKMSDESLALLRGELNDYRTGLQKGAAAQTKGRAESLNVVKDMGGLVYETGRKIVDAVVNVAPDALNLVLFPDFSTHTKDEPSFGRAKVGEMYDELSSQIDPNYAGNPIPRIETSAVKYDFRSEMMRRDINGKLDGDGTKAGDAITTTASVVAPIVIGKVLIPAESPQSLKTLGGLPEVETAVQTSVAAEVAETQAVKSSENSRIIYKEVEIVDKRGNPLGEFDKIENQLFVEDKSAKGLSVLHPKTGKPLQTAEQWAKKQIYEKTVNRIENLQNKAVSTRSTKNGTQIVPSLEEIKTIRKLQFRIEGDTPEIRNAVVETIKNLSRKYPDWNFSAEFGK